MADNNLKMGLKTAWFIALAQLILACFIVIKNTINISIDFNLCIIVYSTLSFIIVLVFANDMHLNDIRDKWFWIFSLFVLAPITLVAYLIKRRKLIKLK
ncbi:MAG TPA: hypothetical protein DG754_00500 [Bacteroidales bacterium]|jgi:NADH:ubiquinone oxidoreductase subunit 3 (subunit A)|nr:hypothetical protein [Bacteroidales bacterium]